MNTSNSIYMDRSNSLHATAFATSTTLAVGTIVSVAAVVTTAAVASKVAFAVLAITTGSIAIASITAWIDPRSTDLSSYFSNVGRHAAIAIAAMFQFTAQIMLQAVIQGAAEGVATSIRRSIAGDDVTVRVRC